MQTKQIHPPSGEKIKHKILERTKERRLKIGFKCIPKEREEQWWSIKRCIWKRDKTKQQHRVSYNLFVFSFYYLVNLFFSGWVFISRFLISSRRFLSAAGSAFERKNKQTDKYTLSLDYCCINQTHAELKTVNRRFQSYSK